MNTFIFDIQRMSFVDGPGIRTTVFFKGCNLNCRWCHNPESQSFLAQRIVHKEKCKHCGKCIEVCPYHQKKCDVCGKCISVCLNDAIEICGKNISTDELLEEIKKDRVFFDNSDGGVTFSGGECMLQIDALFEILKKCRENGISTAVDTAGNVPWHCFEKVIPYTDIFLYDIKSMDNNVHIEYTGADNSLILDNLSRLLKTGKRIWVRIPVIPGVNDTKEEMTKVKTFFNQNGFPEKTELLPYHKMGEHKYELIGRTAFKFEIPEREKINKLECILIED